MSPVGTPVRPRQTVTTPRRTPETRSRVAAPSRTPRPVTTRTPVTARPKVAAPPRVARPSVSQSPAPQRTGAPRLAPWTPFVLCVCALLAGGLLLLLLLNTVLAQDAFVVSKLQTQAARLAEQEATLADQLADKAAPPNLSKQADALGMKPGGDPQFLTEGGTVLPVLSKDEKRQIATLAAQQKAADRYAQQQAARKAAEKVARAAAKRSAALRPSPSPEESSASAAARP